MTSTNTLDNPRRDMEDHRLVPLWEPEAAIKGMAPRPRTQAWLGRRDDPYGIAERAGEWCPDTFGAALPVPA